ncbi:MAG: flavodoxin family protein, partial [Oscillospiraceae bacterium]|nr:flavodoxin family protein [Oscillospiraceae bacterium]
WDVAQERPDFCGMTQWKSYRPKELESPSEFVTLLDLTQENIPYYYFMVKNTEHKILYDADSEALPEIAWQDDETLIVTPVWDGEPHPMDFEPYVEQPWLDEKGEFP